MLSVFVFQIVLSRLSPKDDTLVEGQSFSLMEQTTEPAPSVDGVPTMPVELLRYITPYSEDFDTETDVSHFAPLILNQKKLNLYSMIDTWVGGRPSSFIWLNSTANSCQTMVPLDGGNGNGFDLKATLHFYEASHQDGKATKVVPTMAPMPFGEHGHLGEIFASHAVLGAGGEVGSKDVPQCFGECAEPPTVYKCEYPGAGNCVHQLRNSFKQHAYDGDGFGSSFLQRAESGRVHRSDLGDTRDIVQQLDSAERRYKVHLETGDAHTTWHEGGAVYVPKREPTEGGWGGRSLTDSLLKQAGVIEKVSEGEAEIRLFPDECVPAPVADAMDSRAWKVAPEGGPSPTGSHSAAHSLEIGVLKTGPTRSGVSADGSLDPSVGFVVSPNKYLSSLVENSTRGESGLEGMSVVMLGKQSPRLLSKTVDFGEPLKPNERYLAHFVSSGHGWEHTNGQCGEFCRVNFRLTVDGAEKGTDNYSLLEKGTEAANFNLWRDDCGNNPLSSQMGTWTTSRNGWCPGAVSNGYFADVTDLVQKGGMHKVAVEAGVDGYSPYLNSNGFAYKDPAMLQVGLNFFRYTDSPHVNRTQRSNSEDQPVSFVEFARGMTMQEVEEESGSLARTVSLEKKKRVKQYRLGDEKTNDGFLGQKAPWFTYDHRKRAPEVTVPLFNGIVHQMSNRVITADVATPNLSKLDPNKNYNIGLRLQLRAPPSPLVVDRWDRFATFGMLIPDQSVREQEVRAS